MLLYTGCHIKNSLNLFWGFFLFSPSRYWAHGSKGNFTRFDNQSYGFESRWVHHPTL